MIKYHDNMNGQQYDEDGKLTNNWDTEVQFEDNEYIKVYYRIDTYSYYHQDRPYSQMLGFDNTDEREAFYNEASNILEAIGWSVSGKADAKFNKSHLFIHPQMISGTVMKWEVAYIADHLARAKTFRLNYVDLYENVYDWTDEEYLKILKSQEKEIRDMILERCKTKRSKLYYDVEMIVECVADFFRIPRVGVTDGYGRQKDITDDFIYDEIKKLVLDGYMDMNVRYREYIRTLNETEMKKRQAENCAS